ncbi:serine/threonine-protein kinase [Thermomonospora umbrina]|uniref:non-specific serine/threonine protein kinase n=1 Tax=Thermomonospora umbrina TaxID=111806 RepID=A0A3D9SS33_9ACTN|nr:serine/threonine-protein kinase [Thermomonospora umbrina]REE95775.1 serine/threonine protein kinase [Thermomonospora umbrina]
MQNRIVPAAGVELDGRYRLETVIGSGGMGEVWRAFDLRLRRPVAVKVLPAGLAAAEEGVARFRREAETTATLQHPGITVVFDIGEDRSHAQLTYLVMELLDGEDLRTVMARNTRGLPVAQAIDIAAQLADALAAAHAHGIIHRDVKPANLFLLRSGRLKLCDFGVAGLADAATRLTAQDAPAPGTPRYMAPEQFRGERADPRTDLYALGCVLYELLTGAPPFASDSGVRGLAYQHMNTPPSPVGTHRPDVPPALDRLVGSLLAKPMDLRPASASSVADSLHALAGTRRPTTAPSLVDSPNERRPSTEPTVPPTRRRTATGVVAVVGVLAATMIALVVFTPFQGRDGAPSAESPSPGGPASRPAAHSPSNATPSDIKIVDVVTLAEGGTMKLHVSPTRGVAWATIEGHTQRHHLYLDRRAVGDQDWTPFLGSVHVPGDGRLHRTADVPITREPPAEFRVASAYDFHSGDYHYVNIGAFRLLDDPAVG